MQTDGLDEIQRRLGYRFQRSSLLIEALTHKSYLNEAKETGRVDNERLEFLGDAVLDLVVSEYLLSEFPDAAEGELSKLRARLVSEKTLAGGSTDWARGAAPSGARRDKDARIQQAL